MKIEFRKVLSTSSPFLVENDGLKCSGTFKRLSSKNIEIELNLQGILNHSCDGCLEDFDLKVDETSKLILNDGVYDGDDMDIVECLDGFVDFEQISKSEIESIKSDYHYCQQCENNFKE